MIAKEKREHVKTEIAQLREQFSGTSVEDFREGDWLIRLIRQVLANRSENVSAEYFQDKYQGLDNRRIAYRLVSTSAQYTAAAGAVAGAAVSFGQLATVVTSGGSWAIAGTSLIGELAYITRQQINLIYDIGILLEADLDIDDPEDIMTILWFALGVNIYEHTSRIFLRNMGPRGAEYMGRKLLRGGLRDAMQQALKQFGGKVLARKLTERSVLKLIVPGVNMGVAWYMNRGFTKKLGHQAIDRLKHRSLIVRPLDSLMEMDRAVQLLALSILYHVGILDEPKDINSQLVEMYAVNTQKLGVGNYGAECQQLQEWNYMTYVDFLNQVRMLAPIDASEPLSDVGIAAYLLSESGESARRKLEGLASALSYDGMDRRIQFIQDRYM